MKDESKILIRGLQKTVISLVERAKNLARASNNISRDERLSEAKKTRDKMSSFLLQVREPLNNLEVARDDLDWFIDQFSDRKKETMIA